MNTKVIIGIAVVVVALGVGIYVQNRAAPTVPAPTTVSSASTTLSTTTPQTSPGQSTKKPSSEPKVDIGKAVQVPTFARFDSVAFVSTSTYPVITGTANIPTVGIILNSSKGVGIVGTGKIPVTNGRWSYPINVALAPGTYTAVLYGGATNATATITVEKP